MRANNYLQHFAQITRSISGLLLLLVISWLTNFNAEADPFPPQWNSGAGPAIHYAPAPWPSEPANPADCGGDCGDWLPYTRFQNSVNDPRVQDDSNGGTAPQNYVNVASSCSDKQLPSIYYYLHQGASPDDDVIMFRWRVEQIANNYATGPNAGSYSASSPWSSALWTVLFDIDGSGYRSLAAHLNGSSGSPAGPVDMLAGIWSQTPTQSIDYLNDPNVHLLGHNPTAFVDSGTNQILNFQNSLTPVANWPNGSAENTWDYGTSRARLISTRSCNEYFVDYQIPVAMLDATALGGPKITRTTPISMIFCTANSLNDPFQKDCAINKTWAAESSRPAPFGDYISFNKAEPYSQPIISEVTAVAPSSCGQDYQLSTRIQDVLALVNGEVTTSVNAVDFYYWYDANGNGDADETDGTWMLAASGAQTGGTLNTWSATWNANNLAKGRYLIGVQAVDDNSLVDDDMIATGVDNRTFSYLVGDAQSRIYIDGGWITGQEALFPMHSPAQTPGNNENWYGNPDVTGVQTALVGVAINTCGVAPALGLSVDNNEVGPGDTVVFSITVSNAGNPDTVTVDSITNVLPDGFSYQASSTSGDFGIAEPAVSGQSLTWTFVTPIAVASNESATLSFSASAGSVAGNYNNTATAITGFGDLASDPVAVAVGSARLVLSITPDSYSTSPGGQVSLTIEYGNPSTVAVTNAILSSVLPADTSLASCSNGCASGAGSVSWSLGNIAPGANGGVSMTLDIAADYASNSLTAASTLSADDAAGNPVNATAQSTLYVNVPVSGIAAFTLEKTASAVQIAPGDNATYTLSYENYGGAAATNTVISDTLPAGMSFVSCSGGCSESGGTVTWNLGSVAGGATGSVTVTVAADNPFQATNPAVNTAEISWDGGGPVSASASIGVSGQSCNAYYFQTGTTDVGFDGPQNFAAVTPVPTAGDTGASVTRLAPNNSSWIEAVRFYQDPASATEVPFSGNLTTTIYVDRTTGVGINIRTTVYDYNSVTGAITSLGSSITTFGNNDTGALTTTVALTGSLSNAHRLLWVYEVQTNHATQTRDIQFQWGGTVSNTVSCSGTTAAISNASFCVTPPANLTINKTVDLATVPENTTSSLVYTIEYANLGSATANNVAIIDTLPSGVSFDSATLNGSPIVPSGSNPYTFAVGTVTAAANGTLRINATVANTATGTLINTAAISSNQTSAVSDTAATLVGSPGGGGATAPELYISKTANTGLLDAGGTVIYTLTVVNAGNGDAGNVLVTDDFPEQAYFAYLSCTTATGSCSESPSGTLNWSIGTLAAGNSASLTYQMQAANSGIPSGLTQLNNSASVSDDDYCTGTPPASCSSNTVTVSISGNPKLSIDLSADTATVAPGDVIQYTMLVSNSGSSTANDLSVVNPIPGNTGFVEITSGSGRFDTVENQVIFDGISLAAGASESFSFSVQVGNPLSSGSTLITDTVSVSAGNAQAVSDNVNVTATAAPAINVSLSGPENIPWPATSLTADVSVSNTFTVANTALIGIGDVIRVNGSFTRVTNVAGNRVTVSTPITGSNGAAVELAATYTITYQNTGNANATNVQISQPLPADWLYVSSSPVADSAPSVGSNGTLSWSLGTVAAGASGSLQFTALAISSGSYSHTVTLTADGGINQQANVSALVGGLVVQKSAASAYTEVGGTVTYTITLTNSLSVPVNGVQVKDLLPAGFNYDSAAPTPDSFESGDTSRPIWSIDVPADGIATITLNAVVDADAGAATYQNEVEVVPPGGVGVVQYDALASKTEDITLLAGTGLLTGSVYFDSVPLDGVWIELYENNVLAYRVYTDADGEFQRVLEAGTDWRLEIAGVSDNTTLLTGLTLNTGTDPESFAISAGESLARDLVFGLTAPTVDNQVTTSTTPTITGTYPSGVSGVQLSVIVNGVTYLIGSDLTATGDNWTLTIPSANQLTMDATYDVQATVTLEDHVSSDLTNNELQVISANDTDNDGIPDATDPDDDNDGIPDSEEGNGDTDGDGIPDSIDTDSDNDGVSDSEEGNTDTDGDGTPDYRDSDSDADGIPDSEEGSGDTDGDGTPDYIDTDSDADGIPDTAEGNGDSDGDGTPDYIDTDSDADGIPDSEEGSGDTDDDGTPDFRDTDSDGDGVPDNIEGTVDTDGDGTPDYRDTDSDDDGIPDTTEGSLDTDGDGIPNRLDLDSDNDGIPDAIELMLDSDSDGVIDSLDLDSDNDGLFDLNEMGLADPYVLDADSDGRIDDSNAMGVNGLADAVETFADSAVLNINGGNVVDTDADGVNDFRDLDSDNDGITDIGETGGNDPDGDGVIGTGLPAVDADGIPAGGGLRPVDTDGDGVPDQNETDADNDGVYDLIEGGGTDFNNDGMVDGFVDNNGDGLDDGIANTPLPLPDSDGDNIPDFQDIDDADHDGVGDAQDLDDDNDGIPDALEGDGAVDTDGDGIADSLDLDSDNDGIFDLQESGIADYVTLDSNNNGRIDDNNSFGTNGLADDIETSADSGIVNYNGGIPVDTDNDGLADFRDLDSDADGVFDVVEGGGSDPDNDGVIGSGPPSVNTDGIPAPGAGTVNDDADEPGNGGVVKTGRKGIGTMDFWLLLLLLPLLVVRIGGIKIRCWFAAFLFLFAGSTNAQESDDYRVRLYIGAGVGASWLEPDTSGTIYRLSDDQDYGYRLYAGYDLNDFVSVEFSYADLGTAKLDPVGEIDYSIWSTSALYYFYDQGKKDHVGWAAYAKGGLSSMDNSANIPYEQNHAIQLSFGGGIEYGWKNGIAARIDFETYDEDASLLSAGLLYRFGKPSAKPAPEPEPTPELIPVAEPEPLDADGDGVIDEMDKCPDSESNTIVDDLGCEVDDDKDGVVNRLDQCPQTPPGAEVNEVGCNIDLDGDGVPNSADQCPETPNDVVVDAVGCSVDKDGDGVINAQDQCPDTVKGAPVNAAGCAIFETKLDGVNFESGSAELTDGAKNVLDKVAEALRQFETVRVEIQAHTDNVGKEQSNQTLSYARAKSVAEYLASKGVARDRLQTVGFGESKPIAGNETPQGRAQNRRVEFHVISEKLPE